MLGNAQASVDAVNYAVTNLYRPGAPMLPLSKLDMCTDKQPKLNSSSGLPASAKAQTQSERTQLHPALSLTQRL